MCWMLELSNINTSTKIMSKYVKFTLPHLVSITNVILFSLMTLNGTNYRYQDIKINKTTYLNEERGWWGKINWDEKLHKVAMASKIEIENE